jgi:hypothetical protein
VVTTPLQASTTIQDAGFPLLVLTRHMALEPTQRHPPRDITGVSFWSSRTRVAVFM